MLSTIAVIISLLVSVSISVSVSVSGSYRTILRNIFYQVLGIFKVLDIGYCITDSTSAGMVEYNSMS